jgi:hypothetical protein
MMNDAQQQIIDRALRTTFGSPAYDSAEPVSGGLSGALILRMVVKGQAYLVRVGGSPHADAATEMANVRGASEAGLGPTLRYASIEDRAMITDFIERKPWTPEGKLAVPALIARLQTQAPYARVFHQVDITTGMIARARAAGAADNVEDVFTRFAEVAQVYPRDAMVACHNDAKAPNVLFDGTRPWLVDWEAAFSNDRFADLAYSAWFFCDDDDAYLAAYLGGPPDDVQRARFFLMRFVIDVSYVAFVSLLEPSEQEDLVARLASARTAIASPRFADALACVSRSSRR